MKPTEQGESNQAVLESMKTRLALHMQFPGSVSTITIIPPPPRIASR